MSFSQRFSIAATTLTAIGLLLGPSLALGGADASTFRKKPGVPESTWSPANVIDGKPATIWMEGAEGAGEGSWLSIDLPRARVNVVKITGGHGEDDRMYHKYSRAKDITLEFYSVEDDRSLKPIKQVDVTLEDKFGPQEVKIEGVDIGGELFGGVMKVIIHNVYEGRDFKDTVVGEVQIILDEYPAQLAFVKATSNAGTEKKDSTEAKEVQGGSAPTIEVTKDVDFGGAFEVPWSPTGPAVGQEVEIEAPDYGLAALIISATADKKAGTVRPQKVQIEVGSFLRTEVTLEDKDGPQRFDFPYTNGYNGGHFGLIKVKILSTYGGEKASVGTLNFRSMATNYSI